MTYPSDPNQPHRIPPVETSYPADPTAYGPPVNVPRRKPRRWLHVVGYLGTAGLFLGIGLGAGGSSTDANLAAPAPEVTITQAVPSPTVTAAGAPAVVKPTPTPKPAPVKATIPDGYSADIPGDVPAGRYKARSDSTDCFYNIGVTGSPDNIVDNGGFIKGSLTVTLKKGETFESHDCGDWTQQ